MPKGHFPAAAPTHRHSTRRVGNRVLIHRALHGEDARACPSPAKAKNSLVASKRPQPNMALSARLGRAALQLAAVLLLLVLADSALGAYHQTRVAVGRARRVAACAWA